MEPGASSADRGAAAGRHGRGQRVYVASVFVRRLKLTARLDVWPKIDQHVGILPVREDKSGNSLRPDTLPDRGGRERLTGHMAEPTLMATGCPSATPGTYDRRG